MNKVYLTPIDQEALDPIFKNRLMLRRFNVTKQTFSPKPSLAYLKGDWYLNKLVEATKQFIAGNPASVHQEYYEWNLSYAEKYGRQGGTFPKEIMQQSYARSYDLAARSVTFHYAKIGSDWLARYCQQLVDRYGHPNYSYVKTINTNSALPTGLKKGTFYAETIGFKPYRHLLPNLPGQRYMRKKCRTINQDACANVRLTERILNNARNFLRDYIPRLFGSWLNPDLVVRPTATTIVDRNLYSVETDYEKMDEHFGYDATVTCVLPVYKAILDPADYLTLDIMVSEMYDQPIYFGNFMYTGRHNLLSGQNPTNDFETIFQVCQTCGILLDLMDLDPLTIPQLHLGDDLVVAFNTEKKAQIFFDAFISESNSNGLDINKEKSVIRHGKCQYCRKFYYKGGKRDVNSDGQAVLLGAYPSILCLNSIINPERVAVSQGIEALSTYQRLDNCIGSPDYVPLIQLICKHTNLLQVDITDDDLVKLPSDWWFRLYGERWDPLSSPTFNLVWSSKFN
nr:MAG: RNA-dependent RNA polymerase [Porcine picobirnavirus]